VDAGQANGWNCPICARRVPTQVATCRCGFAREDLQRVAERQTAPDGALASTDALIRVVAAIIVSAGVTTAGWYLWTRLHSPTPTLSVPGAAVHSAPIAQADVRVQAPSSDHPADSATPPTSDEPSPNARPDTANEANPPLEDLVARIGPAVVAIETSAGRGSGFFVQKDTIVTNAHVAGNDFSVRVRLASGEMTTARVDRVAPDLDLAILKLSAPIGDQAVVDLGEVGHVRPGEDVVAIGSPLGVFQNSVTRGIVSAIRVNGPVTLVQTDAAINPGNSGGPLMNRHGVVIGINTMGVRNAQGISFAVGVDHARELLSGHHVATTDSTPIRALNDSLQSSSASETDMQRAKAVRTYESSLASVARRADQLDSYWRRFKSECFDGTIAGSFDREWFTVFERDRMHGTVSPACLNSFSTVTAEANAIKNGVAAAEEAARKGDVYPGIRRDLRQKYRLDYAGWDR
jgi:S1-C subfamily serine protease